MIIDFQSERGDVPLCCLSCHEETRGMYGMAHPVVCGKVSIECFLCGVPFAEWFEF